MSRRKHPATEGSPAGDLSGDEPVEPVHQTNFWLSHVDVDFLDTLVLQLRRGGWRGVTRSACVRALIALVRDETLDLASVRSEPDLVRALRDAVASQRSP